VVKTDSPRLTGFELTEAGAAACSSEAAKLRQLALDQEELPPQNINALVEDTIKAGQREALAALAAHDRKAAPAPAVNSVPPIT
jgi:hypothetical protein